MRDLNFISGEIVEAAFQIHSKLGPGLLESVYEVLLAHKLQKRGLSVQRQVRVPISFDGVQFDEEFRADIIVESAVILKIKSVEQLAPVHGKQLLTYLKLMDFQLGLLINFGAPVIKDGIKRVVNNYNPSAS